jgi:hypothetical protein
VHYFFKRSALCDSGEFFDGAAQVSPSLDFKTRCSTGAPGILVVAPSTDKVWVRTPWGCGAPQPIPEALLLHVARPQGAPRAGGGGGGGGAPLPAPPRPGAPPRPAPIAAAVATAQGELFRLSFSDDKAAALPQMQPAARLAALGFFAPLLSGRWPTGASFQVPCQRAVFDALLSVMAGGDLPLDVEPSPALLYALHAAGDELGAPAPRALLPMGDPAARLGYRADLFALCPAWWRADAEEEARMARGESSVGALVRVNAKLAKALLFEPVTGGKGDGRWLFQEQPPAVMDAQKGLPVLETDPEAKLAAALPKVVGALLAKYPKSLAVAGGAVLGAVAQIPPPGTDVDLFVHSAEADLADLIAVDVKAAAAAAGYKFSESSCAFNFEPPAGRAGSEGKPFQLVLCLHKDRAQILEAFDLAPCKVLARAGPGGVLVVEALPAWCEALKAMAFWVDPTAWSKTAVGRVFKYVAKGFEACVPGTRRAAVVGCAWRSWMSKDPRRTLKRNVFTLDALFNAEAEHVFGTLNNAGAQHWAWDRGGRPPSKTGFHTNPSRVDNATVAAVSAAMWGAPELDVDHEKLPNKVKPGELGRGSYPQMFGGGRRHKKQYTYEHFWGPATREARSTDASLARRNAALKAAEQAAAAEGAVASASGGGGGGGGGSGGGVAAVEVSWSTVRATARFAPWDAGLSSLHNPEKLAALVDKEAAERTAAVVGPACTACGKFGAKVSCGACKQAGTLVRAR